MSGRTTLPETTDVVVVGAGVMGASIAYFLSTASDLKVTVVEKSTIAAGSTGDSSANIRHDYGDQRIYSELALWSHEFFREFEAHTGQPLAYVPCPRVRFGKEGTREGEFIRAGYEILRDLGVPAVRQPKDELEAAYPMFADLCRFDFAIRDPTAAYSDATDATNGFVRAAIEAGATLSTGTEVEGFEIEDGAVAGVVTDAGTVECDAAVVAAGPWTPRLGEMVGVDVPITPSREDVFVLDPPPEFEPHVDDLPIVRFFGGEWYMRPDFGGGVLVATHPFAEEAADPDDYRQEPDEGMLLSVVDLLEENVPGLVDADVTARYCGLYSTTPDHDFIIDQVGPEGWYVACGFSGHGFKHAPAVGRMTRDLVVEGETDLCDRSRFAYDRFRDDDEGRGRPVEPL